MTALAMPASCPFDGPHNFLPTDPCPVCGDLGAFFDDDDEVSACPFPVSP